MTDQVVNELFNIPEQNVEGFLAKIKKLNRKIEKLGFSNSYLSADPVGWHMDEDKEKRGISHKIFEIYVYAENVKMGDHTFIARLRHDKTNGTIVEAAPGKQVPVEYQTSDHKHCDHCHVRRYRVDTFVLQNNKTGVFVQVGRTCLKDFLGHDIDKMIRLAQIVASVRSMYALTDRLPKVHNYVMLSDFLALVVREIEANGWVPRSRAEIEVPATADEAWDRLTDGVAFTGSNAFGYKPYLREREVEPTESELAVADSVIVHWAAYENKPTKSDYENNCMVIAKEGMINWRDAGYAASMVSSFQRAQEAAKGLPNVDLSLSQHVGAEKELLKMDVTVLASFFVNSFYGRSRLTKFIDGDGNVFAAFGGTYKQDPKKADKIKIRARVKRHSVYKDIKETQLNYVKEV